MLAPPPKAGASRSRNRSGGSNADAQPPASLANDAFAFDAFAAAAPVAAPPKAAPQFDPLASMPTPSPPSASAAARPVVSVPASDGNPFLFPTTPVANAHASDGVSTPQAVSANSVFHDPFESWDMSGAVSSGPSAPTVSSNSLLSGPPRSSTSRTSRGPGQVQAFVPLVSPVGRGPATPVAVAVTPTRKMSLTSGFGSLDDVGSPTPPPPPPPPPPPYPPPPHILAARRVSVDGGASGRSVIKKDILAAIKLGSSLLKYGRCVVGFVVACVPQCASLF